MKGLHRKLNTKADYEYVMQNEPESSWRPAWESLLNSRKAWQELSVDESADDYDAENIRTVPAGEGEETVIQVYKEDQNCKLYRLGFTVDEITAALE
jgi:hypothetical protein